MSAAMRALVARQRAAAETDAVDAAVDRLRQLLAHPDTRGATPANPNPTAEEAT